MAAVTATVTSKGQVTIPREIRKALDIGDRTRLMFVLEGDSIRVVPIGRRSLAQLKGALPSDRSWSGMEVAREGYREDLARRLIADGQ
jgi:AbrB family looped-hinge helix DNA binding protein